MTASFDPSRAHLAQPVASTDIPSHKAEAQHLPRRFYRSYGKRAFDLLFALLVLPVVLPVVLVLAILIALDGGRPFYSQERVGRGGATYRMWKLRTMVIDAEHRLKDHLATDAAAREEWNLTQKLRQDPRITPIGRFLRKTSLDELPQVWNVLMGEMSVVGPRPMLPDQRALYHGTEYFALRPGITGPWQVSCRNASSFAERVSFDALYFRSLSLTLDIRLILATTWVVVLGTGH